MLFCPSCGWDNRPEDAEPDEEDTNDGFAPLVIPLALEEEEYPEVAGNCDYGDLPDLTEYEKMIDWDELPDVENCSELS